MIAAHQTQRNIRRTIFIIHSFETPKNVHITVFVVDNDDRVMRVVATLLTRSERMGALTQVCRTRQSISITRQQQVHFLPRPQPRHAGEYST